MLWMQSHLPSPAFQCLLGLFLSFLILTSSGKRGRVGFPTVSTLVKNAHQQSYLKTFIRSSGGFFRRIPSSTISDSPKWGKSTKKHAKKMKQLETGIERQGKTGRAEKA